MDQFRGYKRQEIPNLTSYFGTIMNSLLLNMKRLFVQVSLKSTYNPAEVNLVYSLDLDVLLF